MALPTAAPAGWPAVSPVHMLESTRIWIYNHQKQKKVLALLDDSSTLMKRLTPLRRSKQLLELARLQEGARHGSAWLLENNMPASVSDFKHAWLPGSLDIGARGSCSAPLGPSLPLGFMSPLEKKIETENAMEITAKKATKILEENARKKEAEREKKRPFSRGA